VIINDTRKKIKPNIAMVLGNRSETEMRQGRVTETTHFYVITKTGSQINRVQ
jgi:hypothetical protein